MKRSLGQAVAESLSGAVTMAGEGSAALASDSGAPVDLTARDILAELSGGWKRQVALHAAARTGAPDGPSAVGER